MHANTGPRAKHRSEVAPAPLPGCTGIATLLKAIRAVAAVGPLLFGVTATAAPLAAQQVARVSGSIAFATASGQLDAAICVRDADGRGPSEIELNTVLHIREVDGQDPLVVTRHPVPGGEAVRYRLRRPSSAAAESPLCIRYSGVVPRFPDQQGGQRDSDHAGVLAFDGRNLRARGAARWLPFPIDPGNGMPPEAVAVDLTVRCADCATIYFNGFRPVRGTQAVFRRTAAAEPFLLLGDYPVRPTAGGWIVAPDSLWSRADSLLSVVRRIDRVYQNYLGIAERPRIDLVAFPEVREPARGRAWAFFADPALGIEASSIAAVARALESDRRASRENAFALLAHEAAHRYFGWSLGTRSPQRDLFGEPLATLLELHAVHELLGPAAAARHLAGLRERAGRLDDPVPLATATARDFAVADYRYGSAPIQLLALIEHLGDHGTQRFLRAVLDLPPDAAARATWRTLISIVAGLQEPGVSQ